MSLVQRMPSAASASCRRARLTLRGQGGRKMRFGSIFRCRARQAWSRFGVFLKKWKKSSTESDDSKLGWSFMISTREIIEFHVALNLDWFLQNGDLPFFIHPNFLMSTMATWLSRSPLVPRYLCLMSVPIGSYSLQVGGLFELDPTERDHGTTVLLYEEETRICHNWDLGDYFLRPLWGKKITNLCLVERFWLISGTFYS